MGGVGIVGGVGRDRGLFPHASYATDEPHATFYAGFIPVMTHLPWRSPLAPFTTARWAVMT